MFVAGQKHGFYANRRVNSRCAVRARPRPRRAGTNLLSSASSTEERVARRGGCTIAVKPPALTRRDVMAMSHSTSAGSARLAEPRRRATSRSSASPT